MNLNKWLAVVILAFSVIASIAAGILPHVAEGDSKVSTVVLDSVRAHGEHTKWYSVGGLYLSSSDDWTSKVEGVGRWISEIIEGILNWIKDRIEDIKEWAHEWRF